MPHHEDSHCPRCENSFECCVGSISRCACTRVMLSAEQRERIAAHYGSCLCAPCLAAIGEGAPIEPMPALGARVPAGAPRVALRAHALSACP